eukprot:6813822-Prymnesium_polylepis.1
MFAPRAPPRVWCVYGVSLASHDELQQPALVAAATLGLQRQLVSSPPLTRRLKSSNRCGAQPQPRAATGAVHAERAEPLAVKLKARADGRTRPVGDGERRAAARDEERAAHVGRSAHCERRGGVPPANHRRRAAEAEGVERRPERPRVAAHRVGVDAARHAEDERVPLLRVVAEYLALQPKRDARDLGEPLLGAVRLVVALLAKPQPVNVRVELGVRQVRVAGARRVQVEQKGRRPRGGERLERGAQPAEGGALVRRSVEVDAVDVEVAHEPQDALDPVVVPPRGEGGRVHRRVDLAVG